VGMQAATAAACTARGTNMCVQQRNSEQYARGVAATLRRQRHCGVYFVTFFVWTKKTQKKFS